MSDSSARRSWNGSGNARCCDGDAWRRSENIGNVSGRRNGSGREKDHGNGNVRESETVRGSETANAETKNVRLPNVNVQTDRAPENGQPTGRKLPGDITQRKEYNVAEKADTICAGRL